jgi:hypothetical protein
VPTCAASHRRSGSVSATSSCARTSRAGVTTVLEAANRVGVVRELRAWNAGGHPGPTFLTLRPPIAPRSGYMSLLSPDLAVSSVDDLDRVHAAGMLLGASLAEVQPLRFAGALVTYLGGFVLVIATLVS